ncbi:MAG: HAMP domain-containing histidine kinase [Clostridium sp.]|nr:HAMP domain-containing histidine kinase [Clostridium sp.]
MTDLTGLDQIPQAAFEIENGQVTALNPAARRLLPGLALGAPAPAGLDRPIAEESDAGVFTLDGVSFRFSRTVCGSLIRVLVSPAPQAALTAAQLDGFLRQMRQFQGELLMEFHQLCQCVERRPDQETSQCLSAFHQSFYRMFRTIGNLEFLQAIQDGSLPFQPVTMDLSGLCSQLAVEAGELLSQAGVALDFRSECPSLLIPGDSALLSRMLSGLLSNAAKHAPGGRLSLRLSLRREQAVLLLTQNVPLTQRQLDDLLDQSPQGQIPLPTQGAGLGLTVVRHIIALHGGSLFWEPKEDGLVAAVSLPTGPLSPRASLHTPSVQRDGGLSRLLVELSDVLPPSAFEYEGLD